MTAGDVKKGDSHVMELTAMGSVSAGDLVHMHDATGYHQATTGDLPPYAVAIEASSNGVFRGVVQGLVEVGIPAAAGSIPRGALVIPAASGQVGIMSFADLSGNTNVGMCMDASANNLITIYLGRK